MIEIEPIKSKEELWESCLIEEMDAFIKSQDNIEDELRKRLFLLSGCRNYGEHDPMNGSCVDCYYENRDLHERCCAFGDMIFSYNIAKKT